MAAVLAESMVGGNVIPPRCDSEWTLQSFGPQPGWLIHRAFGTQQVWCTLTTPSFLSRGTQCLVHQAKTRSKAGVRNIKGRPLRVVCS